MLMRRANSTQYNLQESYSVKCGVGIAAIWIVFYAAIGVAGMEPLKDYRGVPDTEGQVLQATVLAVADELASAAELVMGKVDGIPIALIRGYPYTPGEGSAAKIIRSRETDLFR